MSSILIHFHSYGIVKFFRDLAMQKFNGFVMKKKQR